MPIADLILPADWKILLGGAAAIVGLAFLILLIALTYRRSARDSAVPAKAEQPVRCPRRDWEIVTSIALAGLSQVEAALALHARAAERVDAAEYALGRLLTECATIMQSPAPRRRPVPILARTEHRFAEALAA